MIGLVAAGAVERLLDRQHLGIVGGALDELHHRAERLVGVVDQDVLVADQVEHVGGGGKRGGHTGHQGLVLQIAEPLEPVQRHEAGEVDRAGHPVDVAVLEVEGRNQHLDKALVRRLGDLQPHRVAPHPLAEVLLDGLEQVLASSSSIVRSLLRVTRKTVWPSTRKPPNSRPQVGRDHVLQQHEPEPVRRRAGQRHHPVEHRGDLDHGEQLLQLAGLLALDQEREVQALVVQVRERVPGVDRQRGQDRIDLVLKYRSRKARSVGLSSSSRTHSMPLSRSSGDQLLVQQLILVRRRAGAPAARSGRAVRPAPGRRRGSPGARGRRRAAPAARRRGPRRTRRGWS